MPLKADDPADRAAQLQLLTERLANLVSIETASLRDGHPLRPAESSEEFQKLANLYRQEMGRIKQEPSLIAPAPRAAREKLQNATADLQRRLDDYAAVLGAARAVAEGLVKAIAEEAQRVGASRANYGAQGQYAGGGPSPMALDRRA